MRALKNRTIPELITHLSALKVEWVGATTRKAPLIELIERVEALPLVRSESDLPSTMRFVSAPVDSYTWEQLILIWRHFNRSPLTSEEALDRDILWAKVKALLCSLRQDTNLPSQVQGVTHMDTQRLLKVVERTASHGLAQPDRAKWMLIWACDICGELAEFIASRELVEAGDVLWGIGAVSLITNVSLPYGCASYLPSVPQTDLGVLCTALGLLDHLKKVARDGLEYRALDEHLIFMTFCEVLVYLSQHVNLDEAVSAVEIKLLKRYPDGYSADKSVNRVI